MIFIYHLVAIQLFSRIHKPMIKVVGNSFLVENMQKIAIGRHTVSRKTELFQMLVLLVMFLQSKAVNGVFAEFASSITRIRARTVAAKIAD